MDKRLEEIKFYESMKVIILKKEPDEDKHWLINRVDELREENKELKQAGKFFESGYHQFEKDNQRYKQALEEIAKEIYLEGDSDLVTQNKLIRVILKARQALGGDGNA
ncbi:hypothetical protein [Oceanobacillus jeddahense]|uniref:hypothetical protein n=1 Tax=Oceanobacillus jeddahense TaxID=1462527 RepID=UPI00059621E4|nr:hypothetical protein [Oceanobacillus jeddahense]